MTDKKPLCELLDRWKAGDQSAAAAIFQRYEHRLRHLARQQLDPDLRARIDPDDIVITVLDTALRRLADGQYTVDPTGILWHLLRKIATNKIHKHTEYHRAKKRDVRVEIDGTAGNILRDIEYQEPTPEEAAVFADELDAIRKQLEPFDFEVFQMRFEGYSYREIARELERPNQTIRYRAKRIERWLADRNGHR